jgi:hypothetical protein
MVRLDETTEAAEARNLFSGEEILTRLSLAKMLGVNAFEIGDNQEGEAGAANQAIRSDNVTSEWKIASFQ